MKLHLYGLKGIFFYTKKSYWSACINYIQKQVNTISNYRILFLIGISTLLLGIYFIIAYSFLETSSEILFNKQYYIENGKESDIKIGQKNDHKKGFSLDKYEKHNLFILSKYNAIKKI
ncbi:hypothetical protein [Aquimarina sediminis]|uniref:hypothetical protein n=1 Tax=Aquimarina sediminis TaxID=2070536 RepID=UPI000CA01092|nr:hypothetical protein [Aquimarina sediminis]